MPGVLGTVAAHLDTPEHDRRVANNRVRPGSTSLETEVVLVSRAQRGQVPPGKERLPVRLKSVLESERLEPKWLRRGGVWCV